MSGGTKTSNTLNRIYQERCFIAHACNHTHVKALRSAINHKCKSDF